MATHQPFKPRPPAFLNWKGLRRWSVGRRAPSLCKLFYNARSSPKVGLVMVGKLLSNIKSSSATAAATTTTTTTTVTEAASRAASAGKAAPASPPRALQVQLSAASNAATTIKRSISYSNNNNNSTPVGAMALANCLRRKSDAIAPPPRQPTSYRRFSVDSHPYTAAYHLSRDNHDQQQVPKILRLGSSSAASAQAAERSIMFMGSPAVAKVKETCARILTVAAQHNAAHHHPVLLGDLFVGNPFLTRVNPAPVSSSSAGGEQVTPSFGLLDASLKCRDSELKDRIVFFL